VRNDHLRINRSFHKFGGIYTRNFNAPTTLKLGLFNFIFGSLSCHFRRFFFLSSRLVEGELSSFVEFAK
jgi:hypothetical protein